MTQLNKMQVVALSKNQDGLHDPKTGKYYNFAGKRINKPEQTFTKDVCLLIARQAVVNSLHPTWRG